MRTGWFNERARHSLAAKGISSKYNYQSHKYLSDSEPTVDSLVGYLRDVQAAEDRNNHRTYAEIERRELGNKLQRLLDIQNEDYEFYSADEARELRGEYAGAEASPE
jgi:hypothetical protein